MAWQEASNDMQLDFLRYLVPEKIDILDEILTLIERTITPLQEHEFWIAFKHKGCAKNAFLWFSNNIHLYLVETNLEICENVFYEAIK